MVYASYKLNVMVDVSYKLNFVVYMSYKLNFMIYVSYKLIFMIYVSDKLNFMIYVSDKLNFVVCVSYKLKKLPLYRSCKPLWIRNYLELLDKRHMKVAGLSALRTGRLYPHPPGDTPWRRFQNTSLCVITQNTEELW
jgi:hypothetical protein